MKKAAYITDIHLDEEDTVKYGADSPGNLSRILEHVKSTGADTIIFGGDIGFHTAHEWFFDTMRSTGLDFYLTPGNHDKFTEVIQYFGRELVPPDAAEMCYTIEYGAFKYIFLDTSTSAFSSTQLNWLQKEIDTDKKPVIFMHHPVLRVKTIIDELYSMKNREQVKELLDSTGKDITIFCGHLHTEDRTTEGKITQYVTPASSYQAEKNEKEVIVTSDQFGYRLIEFGENIKTEIVIFNSAESVNV